MVLVMDSNVTDAAIAVADSPINTVSTSIKYM